MSLIDKHKTLERNATLLLAGLSMVGIMFVAAAFLAFDTCQ